MPKYEASEHNTLNINSLPIPIEEGDENRATVLQLSGNAAQPDEKLSLYAIKLIRRLLKIADADFTDISFQDREWLEDVLSGTSIDTIARHAKVSQSNVRYHVTAALEHLYQKVEDWDDSAKVLSEVKAQVKRMESEAEVREERYSSLYNRTQTLEAENKYLRSLLDNRSNRPEKSNRIVAVDESTKKILHRKLGGIGIPPHISAKLGNQNIHIVLELIRLTDHQLSKIEGISDYAVDLIKRILKRYNLSLGSDIRWIPNSNNYYIYPSGNTV